ncbi:MAG: hypothetical protein ACOY3K_03915, partial [Candidatus Omnitrophota bacterium]
MANKKTLWIIGITVVVAGLLGFLAFNALSDRGEQGFEDFGVGDEDWAMEENWEDEDWAMDENWEE